MAGRTATSISFDLKTLKRSERIHATVCDMSAKEYDILLFGVTGFTGKLATEYLLRKNYDIKWGVCGRSAERGM